MSKKIFLLLLPILLIAAGNPNFTAFNEVIRNQKFKEAEGILKNWGKEKLKDPQYYICVFNYHMVKSRNEAVGIQKSAPDGGESLVLTDPDTGETKGYFAPVVHYDIKEAQLGIKAIKKGIMLFPDHFEMRFGLMWALQEITELDSYLSELDSTLKYLAENPSKTIYWNNNEAIKNPLPFTLNNVQGNFSNLMRKKHIFSHPAFGHRYSDILIKHFPKNKFGYSNKGALFYFNRKYEKALIFFKKARKLDKNDLLILYNIGLLYKDTDKTEKAKKTFKEIIKIGGDRYYINQAELQLKTFK